MRKLVVAAIIAAITSVALVASAGARDIPVTLNLIAHTTNGHRVNGENRFVITGSLLKAGDRSHTKGHFKAVFNRNNRIRAILYLRNGKIKVDGHGNHPVIIGGTRHWEGVTGTMDIKPLKHNDARLTVNVE